MTTPLARELLLDRHYYGEIHAFRGIIPVKFLVNSFHDLSRSKHYLLCDDLSFNYNE